MKSLNKSWKERGGMLIIAVLMGVMLTAAGPEKKKKIPNDNGPSGFVVLCDFGKGANKYFVHNSRDIPVMVRKCHEAGGKFVGVRPVFEKRK